MGVFRLRIHHFAADRHEHQPGAGEPNDQKAAKEMGLHEIPPSLARAAFWAARASSCGRPSAGTLRQNTENWFPNRPCSLEKLIGNRFNLKRLRSRAP
jgi:hypothetical protein